MNPLLLLALLGGAAAVMGARRKPGCADYGLGDWNRIYEQMQGPADEMVVTQLPAAGDDTTQEQAFHMVSGYAQELAGLWIARHAPGCEDIEASQKATQAWAISTLVAIQVLMDRGLLGPSEWDNSIYAGLAAMFTVKQMLPFVDEEAIACDDAAVTQALGHWPPQLLQFPHTYRLYQFSPKRRFGALLGEDWGGATSEDATTLDSFIRQGVRGMIQSVTGIESLDSDDQEVVMGMADQPFPLFDFGLRSFVVWLIYSGAMGGACIPGGAGEREWFLQRYATAYLTDLDLLRKGHGREDFVLDLDANYASIGPEWWNVGAMTADSLVDEYGVENLDLVAREVVAEELLEDGDTEAAATVRQLPVFRDFGHEAHRYNEWRGQVDLWATEHPMGYAVISAVENEMLHLKG